MIEAELRQHGVAQEAIEAFRTRDVRADRAPEDESLPTTERERARSALDRHLKGRPLPSDPRAVQRIGMFLMRRGFDSETVRATLRQSGASDDADG
jgi:SOS response regulatory protein OraA/RecX